MKKSELLRLKAISPKSVNPANGAIYLFKKYCKSCNKGLTDPPRSLGKEQRKLYKNSFCSVKCKENGGILKIGSVTRERYTSYQSTFNKNINPKHQPSKLYVELLEELGFSSLQEKKTQTDKTKFILLHVKYCHERFKKLSEKLSYLESKTNQRWYNSKFYFWLNKI